MHVICTYCRRRLPDREPLACTSVSHGICPECFAYYGPQFEGLSTLEFIERSNVPMVLVDAGGRVVGASDEAFTLAGKSHAMLGLLAGEFMECVYARLPEGCGRTLHCSSCALRGAVDAAREGRVDEGQEVAIERDDGCAHFRISARRVCDAVRVVLEEVAR